jgi:hypothetical protein
LKRWVGAPGVQRPKLNARVPRAIASRIRDQYSSMLGARRLCSRSDDAQVISSSAGRDS